MELGATFPPESGGAAAMIELLFVSPRWGLTVDRDYPMGKRKRIELLAAREEGRLAAIDGELLSSQIFVQEEPCGIADFFEPPRNAVEEPVVINFEKASRIRKLGKKINRWLDKRRAA